jgi:predicted alpha/beta superfamily hydrolase
VGNVQVLPDFFSPQLGNRRNILVYLPPSYSQTSARYPVIYMHDGQNLFDAATAYAGEWHVDETMERLSAQGMEAIVVAIPNMGVQRMAEYAPFDSPRFGRAKGHFYIDFIADTLKPAIDRAWRTWPDHDNTYIVGSSMGGLISLFGFFHRPEVFGGVGVLSPALWYADQAIYEYVIQQPLAPGRLYLDAGTRELSSRSDHLLFHVRSRRYYGSVRRMYRRLVQKGYRPIHQVRYVEEKLAHHEEAAWSRRLPGAFRFLLGGS